MASDTKYFINTLLGEDFMESLQKFELWKPGTKSVIDHEEIKTALHIVPRALMSFLVTNLSSMEIGDNRDIALPVSKDAKLQITKHERDVYSGHIEEAGKIVVDFKFRSIPGVGLIIMSAFELYDTEKLSESPKQETQEGAVDKVQKLIDERLALHQMVNNVVDRKMMERDAVNKLLLMRLSDELEHQNKEKVSLEQAVHKKESESVEAPKKKGSPKLSEFLELRKSKSKKKEFSLELAKGEHVDCPDCGKNIFNGSVFSGCICLGDDMERKAHIYKSETGIKVRFSKGWDQENIEMLLEVLRRKRG